MSIEDAKKVLILSCNFPTPNKPNWGVFVAQTVMELKKIYSVSVISPIPWFPRWDKLSKFKKWYEFAKIPSVWEFLGVPVFFPRYLAIPKIGQPFLSLAVFLSMLFNHKRLLSSGQVGVINAQCMFPEGVAAVFLGKFFKIPVVVTALGSDINVESTHPFKRHQISWAIRNSHAVIGVSRDLCLKIKKIGPRKHKIYYVPNGIDAKIFSKETRLVCKGKLGLAADVPILLSVGRLTEIKGHSYLLNALAILKETLQLNFYTIFIGDGPLMDSLLRNANDLGLQDNVLFVGEKEHSEIPTWMTAADVFCLPSINEGQPNVVLEALASGTPVVASAVGGIPDLVDENNGMLFPPADSEQMAKVLVLAMAKQWDPAFVKNSVSGYTWENTASNYHSIFEEIIK